MKQNEVKSVPFNPLDFGFTRYGATKTIKNDNRSYLITGVSHKGQNNYKTLSLSLSREAKEFIYGLLGRTVDLYINDSGVILLTAGDSLKISCKNTSERGVIAMSGLYSKLTKIHGDFRRLYLDMKPYGKGNAVLFTPSRERD